MMHQQDDALGAAIQSGATRYAAPADLRARIVHALERTDPPTREPSRRPRATLWQRWGLAGAAFAGGALLTLALGPLLALQEKDAQFSDALIASHVRSLMANHVSDVESSDQHTVKPWFTGKVDFSPPVQDLAQSGFPLLGGRLDYVNHRPVAALVYGRKQHIINLYVWPEVEKTEGVNTERSRQGFNMVGWSEAGLRFWAISDLATDELRTFAKRLQGSDHESGKAQ